MVMSLLWKGLGVGERKMLEVSRRWLGVTRSISRSVFVRSGSYFEGCFFEPGASSPRGKLRNRRSLRLLVIPHP